jgi:uncharacterized membrane protein
MVLPIDDGRMSVLRSNGDGSVIVGTNDFGAYRWTDVGGTQSLGAPLSTATDVSSNGSVVVGSQHTLDHLGEEAFRWSERPSRGRGRGYRRRDPFQLLGFLPGDSRSRAAAVAGNGGAVVGVSVGPPRIPEGPPSLRAFRWTPARGMHDLGTLPGREGPGEALGISSSGDVTVGQFDGEAFRWTAVNGMVGLGFLPGHTISAAFDVSRDGDRIVGFSRVDEGKLVAFLWTPDGGMRSLEEVLIVDEGLDLAGVALEVVSSISDDGQVITGSGHRDGRVPVDWIADLREIPSTDAYQCYDLKTSKHSARFKARQVSLSDQFGDTLQVVTKGKRLCAPVEVDGAVVSDPEAHLLCYDLKHRRDHGHRPGSEPVDVRVHNEFGDDQRLTVKRPKRLCVPSTKEHAESGAAPGDPWELELDHFLCYGVRAGSRDFEPIEVSLADQFQTSERLLKKPKLLCNPVDKNGEGILDPATHMTCYEVKPLDGEPRLQASRQDVLVSNQFDAEQRFTVKKPKTVCVPSRKELVDDGPAACSAIEPGEFGLCEMVIGWGINPGTGECDPVSGCGCDERCQGRVFPSEAACLKRCGGNQGPDTTSLIVIDDPIFFDLPINSLRYAVSGYDPGTDLCVTAIWFLRRARDQIRHCDDFGPLFPYVLIAPGEPAGCWDQGTVVEPSSVSGCVDWAAFNSPVIPWKGAGSGHTDEADLELHVNSDIWSGTVRFEGPR